MLMLLLRDAFAMPLLPLMPMLRAGDMLLYVRYVLR